MRVVLVHNIIAPYRLELFHRLSSENDVELKVMFLAVSEANRAWDEGLLRQKIRFPFEILKGFHLSLGSTTIHINPDLLFRLRAFKPDCVISVSLTFATAMCWVYSRLAGIPLIVWWAGTDRTESHLSRIKRLWRRWLIPKVACFLVYSEAAGEYISSQGVEARRIIVAGNVSFDVAEFHERVERDKKQSERLKESLNLGGRRVILSVSQFIPRKNLEALLVVFKELIKEFDDLGLVVVGEGPLRESLHAMGVQFAGNLVQLPGHVEPNELSKYYAAADLFVHLALRDHWAQVVGEAMASGLPVVVSEFAHASEMIESGINGYKVDPRDTDAVLGICRDVLGDREKSLRIGRHAYQTALNMDLKYVQNAFLQAIKRGRSRV
jgi:glycosyltransferase involved in cell wall biosynthesis